jgi:hypothetical protein
VARAEESLSRRPGRSLQRIAIDAIAATKTTSRELALRIAGAMFPGPKRDYWEDDKPPEPLSALTVISKLNRLHAGHKNVGVWLLDLAVGAGLVSLVRSYKKPTRVKPVEPDEWLRPLLVAVEDELPPVLRKPSRKTPRSKPDDDAHEDDPKSKASPLAQAAARAVHETKWRVNTYVLTQIQKIGFDDDAHELRLEYDEVAAQRAYPKRRLSKKAYARQRRKGGSEIAARRRAKELKIELEKIKHNELLLAMATRRAYHFPDGFHIPVSFDFRGRIYQDGTALQYTSGSDLARALLEFAVGKRLSELDDWDRRYALLGLQMHMYRCYGERGDQPAATAWLERYEPEITDSVDDAKEHTFWRRGKDKTKYRFLAAAHAWVSATRDDEPLHLPVVFDATNSGLQHCCLLLRDTTIARSVNLTKEQEPQDFYNDMAKELRVERDAAKKVIVPLFYGSKKSAPKEVRGKVWTRMPEVEKLYESLTQVAEAAVKQNVGLCWTTLSGFRVAQFSRERGARPDLKIDVEGLATLGRLQLEATGPSPDTVSAEDMVKGLTPNFVHSLDAALLARILTAEKLMVSGSQNPQPISDWAVAHDSVGVPAWRWHELQRRAGEQMYHMHSDDTLARCWEEWRKILADLPPTPGRRCRLREVPEIDTMNPHAWS